jgi:GNAT superfamily N-acetyltransferase
MIQHHIGSGDWYSDYENIKTFDYTVTRDDEFHDIESYILWTDTGPFIRGLRSGTRVASRGRGLGVALYRRLGRLARRRGKTYKTYSALNNLPSLNAHFKAGMVIERIVPYEGGFTAVHLTTKEPK